ncbi:MAG: transporter, partial [Acidobacteriota bacterium]|nr:transporter [Acidobacteriota bacterium]
MSPKEFSTYRPRTLIGASLIVKGPTGQYDSSKLINIGTNRWSFKPEIGIVQVLGRWAIDAYVGAWFYTDNEDFFGGSTRTQNPIYSTQAHVRYLFKPGLWAAIDGNFWNGGQTTVNGVANDDEQRNSRVGTTLSIRLAAGHNLRIAVSAGAITRIGGDFNSVGVSYNYSWMAKP